MDKLIHQYQMKQKENKMNKQEAIKKTEELEKELAELKAIIEAPDTSELVFKPKYGEKYWSIWGEGATAQHSFRNETDESRQQNGNCFRTEEDAKNSSKFYIMNSDYDYWFPWSGQPKPKVSPKGLQFWGTFDGAWLKTSGKLGNSHVYRWKRSEQV